MTKTILLADDSVTIQKVVELTFMDQDYEVVAVSDGRAALAKLAEMRPDLVIADVHMPEANGYEVCREAKQRHRGLPVLLLVGTFEPFDLQQANAAGADRHLKKPFDSQDLLREVDTLISQAVPPAAAPSYSPPSWQIEEVLPLPSEPAAALPTAGFPVPPPLPEVGAPPAPRLAAPPVTPSVSAFREPPAYAAEPVFPEPEPMLPEPEPVLPEPEPVLPEPEPVSFEPEPTSAYEPVFESEEFEPAPEPVAPRSFEPQYFSADEEPEAAAAASAETEVEVEEAPPPVEAATAANGDGALSEEDVDRIARRVVQLIGDDVLRQVAWDVLPDLAEVVIKERIRELESQVE